MLHVKQHHCHCPSGPQQRESSIDHIHPESVVSSATHQSIRSLLLSRFRDSIREVIIHHEGMAPLRRSEALRIPSHATHGGAGVVVGRQSAKCVQRRRRPRDPQASRQQSQRAEAGARAHIDTWYVDRSAPPARPPASSRYIPFEKVHRATQRSHLHDSEIALGK